MKRLISIGLLLWIIVEMPVASQDLQDLAKIENSISVVALSEVAEENTEYLNSKVCCLLHAERKEIMFPGSISIILHPFLKRQSPPPDFFHYCRIG